MRTPVSVGIVGLGSRGARLARVLADSRDADLCWLCDSSAEARQRARLRHPQAAACASFDEMLDDDSLDAVVIATPTASHYDLAFRALEAEKHVFVERPLALSGREAEELVRLAERRQHRLVAGHELLFHPAIRKLRELIETGRLGDVYFVKVTAHEGERAAGDESVLWSLGADAVAAVLHLVGDEPVDATARIERYEDAGLADLAYCHLLFATGISAVIEVSWLHPGRQCSVTVVGSRRVAVFDDLQPERKLMVYERGSGPPGPDEADGHGEVRFGDIVSPRLTNDDPLRLACDHFLAAARASSAGLADGAHAARVVTVLDLLERSAPRPVLEQALAEGGQVVALPLPLRRAPT